MLSRLKEAESRVRDTESKASLPSPETSQLRSQLKERDNRIATLTKELIETTRRVEVLNKDLAEAKGKVENVSVELQGSQTKVSEVSRQFKDQSKKLEDITSLDTARRRTVAGYIQQFEDLEKRSGSSLDDYVEQNYVKQFNEVLTALKKDLPTDNYVQNVQSLWLYGTRESFASNLKSTSARIRLYLDQRYLK